MKKIEKNRLIKFIKICCCCCSFLYFLIFSHSKHLLILIKRWKDKKKDLFSCTLTCFYLSERKFLVLWKFWSFVFATNSLLGTFLAIWSHTSLNGSFADQQKTIVKMFDDQSNIYNGRRIYDWRYILKRLLCARIS